MRVISIVIGFLIIVEVLDLHGLKAFGLYVGLLLIFWGFRNDD